MKSPSPYIRSALPIDKASSGPCWAGSLGSGKVPSASSPGWAGAGSEDAGGIVGTPSGSIAPSSVNREEPQNK